MNFITWIIKFISGILKLIGMGAWKFKRGILFLPTMIREIGISKISRTLLVIAILLPAINTWEETKDFDQTLNEMGRIVKNPDFDLLENGKILVDRTWTSTYERITAYVGIFRPFFIFGILVVIFHKIAKKIIPGWDESTPVTASLLFFIVIFAVLERDFLINMGAPDTTPFQGVRFLFNNFHIITDPIKLVAEFFYGRMGTVTSLTTKAGAVVKG
jgi:hypothetical protein